MDSWVISIFWQLWIIAVSNSCMCFWTLLFSSLVLYLRVEFQSCMVIWCYWGTSKLFPQESHHFTFLLAMHEGSNFSTALPTLIFFLVTIILGAKRYHILLDFDLYFFNNWWCWYLFMYLLKKSESPLEKCLFKSFTPF